MLMFGPKLPVITLPDLNPPASWKDKTACCDLQLCSWNQHKVRSFPLTGNWPAGKSWPSVNEALWLTWQGQISLLTFTVSDEESSMRVPFSQQHLLSIQPLSVRKIPPARSQTRNQNFRESLVKTAGVLFMDRSEVGFGMLKLSFKKTLLFKTFFKETRKTSSCH